MNAKVQRSYPPSDAMRRTLRMYESVLILKDDMRLFTNGDYHYETTALLLGYYDYQSSN